jgi:hypothetical protein
MLALNPKCTPGKFPIDYHVVINPVHQVLDSHDQVARNKPQVWRYGNVQLAAGLL